jgi:hypothetical protein
MVFGKLALALGLLGRFFGRLLVLLGFGLVGARLLAMAAGPFAQPHALKFSALLGALGGDGDESQNRDGDDDYDCD